MKHPSTIWSKGVTIRNPYDAFTNAVRKGALSDRVDTDNYVGIYMYMFTDADGDHFKHQDTRQYLIV